MKHLPGAISGLGSPYFTFSPLLVTPRGQRVMCDLPNLPGFGDARPLAHLTCIVLRTTHPSSHVSELLRDLGR